MKDFTGKRIWLRIQEAHKKVKDLREALDMVAGEFDEGSTPYNLLKAEFNKATAELTALNDQEFMLVNQGE